MHQRIAITILVLGVGLGTSGCALLAIPALGSAFSSGAGGVAKLGAEHSLGGGTARTFSAPADDVHDMALSTLQRLGIKVLEEERSRDGEATIRGRAYDRRVTMKLEPVTPVMTRLKVVVWHGLGKDQPTAIEIVAQIGRDVEGDMIAGRRPSKLTRSGY